MKRRNAIAKIMGAIDNELVLCNIGFPSRSTGNQETYAKHLDLKEMAKSVGIKNCYNYEEIDLKEIINNNECNFICFNTEPGNSSAPIIDLTPIEIKKRFMKSI